MTKRTIVKIDEEKCNGCGQCIGPCVEGAIELVNGKAKVLREELCDGAGYCIGICPTGALSLEVREAKPFSEEEAEKNMSERAGNYIPQKCDKCGASEDEAVLFPAKTKGRSIWICAQCLPQVIHG
ncbi:MAG TPA: 4Fe-4S dicluster domain-containing protein [Clostridia bacterium]|nr:4Fe-4S dicluster domain-containing protein [Clostridia bacterium]